MLQAGKERGEWSFQLSGQGQKSRVEKQDKNQKNQNKLKDFKEPFSQ